MNFTTTLGLPFHLGKTVEENSALLDDFFVNEKNFGTDLEGFLTLTGTDGEEDTWKIVSTVEDGKCVTARVDFDKDNVTFLDVPIGPDNSLDVAETAVALRSRGQRVIAQTYDLVLPEHFITIEPRSSICYWDRTYWTPEEFLKETVQPRRNADLQDQR